MGAGNGARSSGFSLRTWHKNTGPSHPQHCPLHLFGGPNVSRCIKCCLCYFVRNYFSVNQVLMKTSITKIKFYILKEALCVASLSLVWAFTGVPCGQMQAQQGCRLTRGATSLWETGILGASCQGSFSYHCFGFKAGRCAPPQLIVFLCHSRAGTPVLPAPWAVLKTSSNSPSMQLTDYRQRGLISMNMALNFKYLISI